MKVLTVLGTRPEIIKLSRVIAELDQHVDHVLVHTGQNFDFELNEVFFDQLGVRKPDHFLDAAGETAAETIAKVIVRADEVFAAEQPDAVLILGDTNSCMAVIPAKRRKIPVFHMEAGNRSFDERIPEEINRRIVDHVSDINLVYTEHARRYLLREGVRPETVFKTGTPMREVLDFHAEAIANSNVLADMELEQRRFFLVSAHREENVDDPRRLRTLLDAVNGLAERYGFPVIISTHPRTRMRLEGLEQRFESHQLVTFMKPLGFFEYIKLQTEAACVVSDSGTLTEEASLLGLSAVTIREAHERPEGMDEGVLVMSGIRREEVLAAVNVTMNQWSGPSMPVQPVADYAAANVSTKVLRIIMSYTGYVNRTVWLKPTELLD